MSRVVAGLRWLAVLPGGLLGAALMMFPIHWVLVSGLGGIIQWGADDLAKVERFLQSFVVPCGTIVIGSKIAPRSSLATAYTLATILGLFLLSFYYAVRSGYFDAIDLRIALEFWPLLNHWLGILAGVLVVRSEDSKVRSQIDEE